MYALALADKQDQYDKHQVNELVSQLQSPKLRTLPKVTAQQFQDQLRQMREGTHPITQ